MLRLTVILCVAMFAALLIAGNDRGQMRPGIAKAIAKGEEIVEIERQFSPTVAVVEPSVTREERQALSSALPPPIEIRAAPTIASVPEAEPERPDQPIFTLSALPGVNGPQVLTDEGGATGEETETAGATEPSDPALAEALPEETSGLDDQTLTASSERSLYADPSDGGQIFSLSETTSLADALRTEPPETPAPAPAGDDLRVVDATSVNLRAAPSTESDVVGKLTSGELVRVIGIPDGEWVEVTLEGGGLQGFVAARFLTGSIYQ